VIAAGTRSAVIACAHRGRTRAVNNKRRSETLVHGTNTRRVALKLHEVQIEIE
jgi:hypothetical protein